MKKYEDDGQQTQPFAKTMKHYHVGEELINIID